MPTHTFSDQGLALTKSFEGLRLNPYQDSGGVWTIGYGHTGPEVRAGLSTTTEQADALLRNDVAAAVACVNRALRIPVEQHQFDALVDFCFNTGCGNFLGSTLLRAVNANDFAAAGAQFGLWVHAGGAVIPGLVRRRAAEAAMFAGHPPVF
ncbi:MAG: lysozyme [Acidobacteriota bacterium]